MPTPITRSAASQASLPQAEPVTPGEPKFIGCSQPVAPLPAWVSTIGNVAPGGEVGEQVLGAGIEHAAAGDDHRRLRGADRGDHLRHLDRVGLGPADAPDPRLEEALRVVVGLGLHVLAEGEADRAAVGRIGHRAQRAGQRGQDVLGPGDAVEVAGDRLEAVVGRDRAVVEVLDLLQHRVGPAVGEDVAADEEHRQPVDVGERRGGDHVGRARADRGGDRVGAAAALRLGVGDRGVGHRLLVLAAPGRQRVADAVQRLADAGDVAVAEDRPDALDEALTVLGHLHAQPAHHRLRGGQPDCSAHRFPSLGVLRAHATASRAAARALSQIAQSRA